jgi:hypothetical protein
MDCPVNPPVKPEEDNGGEGSGETATTIQKPSATLRLDRGVHEAKQYVAQLHHYLARMAAPMPPHLGNTVPG